MGIDLTTVPRWCSPTIIGITWGALRPGRPTGNLVKAPSAMSRVHVGKGIFYRRTSFNPGIDDNPALLLRPEFERTGGVFVTHDAPEQIHPGVWVTGPVPREYPERNWSGSGLVLGPGGWVEDNVPEDQALVFDTDRGLVVLVGCAHAGIINTLEMRGRSCVRPAFLP